MRLISFVHNNALELGLQVEDGIIDVATVSQRMFGNTQIADPKWFFSQGLDAMLQLQQVQDSATSDDILQDVTYAPCVPYPQKIICVGLNYARHADESGMAHPTTPILFSKYANALAAHGEGIPLPKEATQLDYEAELVAVVGKRARYVSEEDALDYVLGYCNGNDISARNLQMRTSQWMLGKTSDKFMPIGPYIVTADEVSNPHNLRIRLWLNGELRQDSTTADLIFNVAQCLSYASRYMTLEPGDIISTGTPEGVILGRDPKIWLQAGDEMTVEIDGLGQLTNKVETEA